MTFTDGQRVRTTVDSPAAWEGAFAAPKGTLGTVVGEPDHWGAYGVVLDGDPDRLAGDWRPDELEAVEETSR